MLCLQVENTRDTPAVTITDIMLIEARDIHATMLTLSVRRDQKFNTPQDAVIPPYYIANIYPLAKTDGRFITPGFHLNSAASGAYIFFL